MNAAPFRKVLDAALLLFCLAIGLTVAGLVVRLAGASPFDVAGAIWAGAFGTKFNIADTLVQTVPLLLTGLGVALSFRAKLFNIGAEGQLLAGAMAATFVGIQRGLPAPVVLPLCLCAGAVAGGMWAGIAALLKLARGVPEVLSTLLLNFVAVQLLAFMVRGPLQETARAFPQSDAITIPARLVVLLPQTRLHSGVLLAVLLAVCVWFYLTWTQGGFALRAVGAGPGAAQAAGIPLSRTLTQTFVLSGMLSGLAGAVQICGVLYRLSDGFSPGYGYTAIAVALLANLSPLGVVPSALLFGALTAGGTAVQQRIPGVSSVVVQILQAVLLLAVLGYGWAKEQAARAPQAKPATNAEGGV
jgi:simple sugar transport system permease protein